MQSHIKKLFLLHALIAGLGLILMGHATAQTFTPLHIFTALNYDSAINTYTNSDGAYMYAGLILSGNILYGTAQAGGSSGSGTVFAVNTDSTGFTNLYSFTALSYPNYTNSDGANPVAGLILSGNTLYGTAEAGGTHGQGTVFAVNTNGTGFTNLYNFTGNGDGLNPVAGLVLSGNTLYGTAEAGGSSGYGTLFAVNTNGTGFTTLYTFSASDGGNPVAGLILSSNVLYGTTETEFGLTSGTVFAFNTNNGVLTTLHSFPALVSNTNTDGWEPMAGLILSGNTLYGTAYWGGSSGYGTVFAVNTDGTNFTVLHNFTSGSDDGAYPAAGLILSGNTLYGTANGGSPGYGTVFAVNTNGTGFTNLYNFTGGDDGANPIAGLILGGNTLYGTAKSGAIEASLSGTVFSLSLPLPQLNITLSGTNVILTWPTNVTGFTLQSTTNLVPPVVWSSVSGQYAVTNLISGTQKFYRLSQ
jgi:uncharacterized repeat protein (TIGR03803 family)